MAVCRPSPKALGSVVLSAWNLFHAMLPGFAPQMMAGAREPRPGCAMAAEPTAD